MPELRTISYASPQTPLPDPQRRTYFSMACGLGATAGLFIIPNIRYPGPIASPQNLVCLVLSFASVAVVLLGLMSGVIALVRRPRPFAVLAVVLCLVGSCSVVALLGEVLHRFY